MEKMMTAVDAIQGATVAGEIAAELWSRYVAGPCAYEASGDSRASALRRFVGDKRAQERARAAAEHAELADRLADSQNIRDLDIYMLQDAAKRARTGIPMRDDLYRARARSLHVARCIRDLKKEQRKLTVLFYALGGTPEEAIIGSLRAIDVELTRRTAREIAEQVQ